MFVSIFFIFFCGKLRFDFTVFEGNFSFIKFHVKTSKNNHRFPKPSNFQVLTAVQTSFHILLPSTTPRPVIIIVAKKPTTLATWHHCECAIIIPLYVWWCRARKFSNPTPKLLRDELFPLRGRTCTRVSWENRQPDGVTSAPV